MSLASIMPEVTAETMRQQVVDVETHPYAAELLRTILDFVKKATQAKSTTLAVANIRGITYNRLWKERDTDSQAMKLFLQQNDTHLSEDLKPIYNGNHSAHNPHRWKPTIFLQAIRTLTETELKRRGFTCNLCEKTKQQHPWAAEAKNKPATYWVLELAWT